MRRKSKSTRTQSRSRKTRGKVKRKSFRAKRKQSERSKFYRNLETFIGLGFVILLFSDISPRDFTYSYRYMVDDKLYYEDSRIEGLKLWDRIPIEYSKSFPSFSRVIKEEFEEEY